MSVPFDATPILRLVARRRVAALARIDAAATQQALLARLLARAAGTRFGREHGFAGLRSHADFRQAVPLRRYEAMWVDFWRRGFPVLENVSWPGRIPYFALSSGTSSGRTKHVPVSRQMVAANRGAALDVLAWHLAHHPAARPLAGPGFMLGGSTDLTPLAPGVRAGDLSGIAAAEVPRFLRAWNFPPPEIALMPDWERKLDCLAATAPADARILSGTPSWLLVLLERMRATRGRTPLPALELLIHGGVAWAPYQDRLAPFLPRGCATREVYAASEGFFGVADGADGAGMRVCLDRGVFFEFVPVGEVDAATPTRLAIHEVETGVDYAIAVTTCAGLFAYLVGDVVRFVSRDPPRLLMVGRISDTLSTFGEHVTGEEIAGALSGIPWREYMVGAAFDGALGRHVWIIEADAPIDPSALDARLSAANDDYRAHREGGQLAMPEVVLVPEGRFAAWMQSMGKGGGQHKVPRVVADPSRFAEFRAGLLSRAGPVPPPS